MSLFQIRTVTLTRLVAIGAIAGGLSPCCIRAADAPACSVLTLTGDANNAEVIASKLDAVTGSITVRAVDQKTLLVCADPATTNELRIAVQQLSAKSQSAPSETDNHSIRLFFNRDAGSIAKALDSVYKDVTVQPVGSDTLVFRTTDPKQEENIRELKRWVALLDVPRPELTLNVWSVQLSSKNLQDLNEESSRVRAVVSRHNQQLHDSLERSWRYLTAARNAQGFYDTYFSDYIGRRQQESETSSHRPSELDLPACDKDQYCLGFGEAFRPLRPALTHMLGVLAAAANPSVADQFVDCLEGAAGCQVLERTIERRSAVSVTQAEHANRDRRADASNDCEARDQDALIGDSDSGPSFTCFRLQLRESLAPERKALLRAALADFLFQYKFATEHPHNFDVYDYSTSAQSLDAQFDPLLVAFNRDVAVFMKHLQQEIERSQSRLKSVGFASSGTVTVRTISGTDSEFDTTTQNAFKTTPPPLAQDFFKNLGDAEKNDPALLKANLSTHAAEALTAFLNSGKSATVSIGRALNLKMSPVSLPGASAAELKIHLESKDDGAPQSIAPDGSTKADTTDRVSQQTIDTNVRVDSLKLFDVSSFSAALSRGREPIPLLPPFVDLPYIGSLVHWKPRPSTVYHRTFAIVSAVVVPTAADMLSGLRFKWNTSNTDLQQVRTFHERKLACIVSQTNLREATSDSAGADCLTLKLDSPDKQAVVAGR
jgi:hypothetical protein